MSNGSLHAWTQEHWRWNVSFGMFWLLSNDFALYIFVKKYILIKKTPARIDWYEVDQQRFCLNHNYWWGQPEGFAVACHLYGFILIYKLNRNFYINRKDFRVTHGHGELSITGIHILCVMLHIGVVILSLFMLVIYAVLF